MGKEAVKAKFKVLSDLRGPRTTIETLSQHSRVSNQDLNRGPLTMKEEW
jgi:hypothetical protein